MARDILISIPSEYDADQRASIGEAIVSRIIERTNQGKDKFGQVFKSYSKSYRESLEFRLAGKSSRPNLKFSGDLHRSLRVLSHGRGFIKIGWPDGEESLKSMWTSRPERGGRDMLGITSGELNDILARFPLNRREPSDSFIGSIASEFVRRLRVGNTSD